MGLAFEKEVNWNLVYTGVFTLKHNLILPLSKYSYIGEIAIALLLDFPFFTVKAESR